MLTPSMQPEAHNCGCGRSFPGPGSLKFHQCTCKSTKKHLHGVHLKAKELWKTRKRPPVNVESRSLQNVEDEPMVRLCAVTDLSTPPAIPEMVKYLIIQYDMSNKSDSVCSQREDHNMTQTMLPDDENLSLVEHRPQRLNRQLPKWFQDVVPQLQPLVMSISGSYCLLCSYCH